MSEFRKLEEEHRAKVQQLQDNCPHEIWGKWTGYMWAPGHMAQGQIRICKRCGKVEHR